ncbi:hypothetical protein DPMN_066400 [Dreissena polymorpha]|uniref:Uncharacterized protein n=1 Tax=Dreissena polymorpha TaxID=45954 RepID=A0A9D3YTY6_DREPO|nr:hypothetical protein DPMN_066400 [Dreissena polymorpha]
MLEETQSRNRFFVYRPIHTNVHHSYVAISSWEFFDYSSKRPVISRGVGVNNDNNIANLIFDLGLEPLFPGTQVGKKSCSQRRQMCLISSWIYLQRFLGLYAVLSIELGAKSPPAWP